MNDPHLAALLWISTMPERDRRASDATAGRMFARLARAVRRPRLTFVLGQPETSTR